ncbi:MAG TPA: alkaline phosphatase family protein [Longimicrobiales bacterium]|nr:alkaline phosphatase family protein [Longimicrobiales bacterium]
MARVLFVFLDGVGIGTADPGRNPFLEARLPVLRELLGGRIPTLDHPSIHFTGEREAAAFPLDATLGVAGLPQSGTGQTALLTGENGAERFGRHFGPWVPVALRPVVEERSVLRRVVEEGRPAVFANAYPREWALKWGTRRIAGAPLAARAAGLLTREQSELAQGRAVSSEIVNDRWRARWPEDDIPDVTAEDAGRTLADLAGTADLTFYAHYTTDIAGHRGSADECRKALERVDGFLGGILAGLPEDHLLLVGSDHGNVEDLQAGHTRNPALGLLVGPGAHRRAAGLSSLMDPAPAILGWLERD